MSPTISFLAFFLSVVFAEKWLSASGSSDNDRTRQYIIGCSIKSNNVNSLTQLWKADLSGNVLDTPTLDGRGGLYVSAYGNATSGTVGTIYKLNEDTGAVIWATSLASCNGKVGAQSRTSPALSLLYNLAVVGDVTSGSIVALNMNTGACVWNTVVDSHIAAGITGSATIQGSRGYIGVSSQETAFAVDPTYPCCTFVGSMVSFNVATGAIIWQKKTIPASFVGVGNHSGAAIWGSSPAISGALVCIGTGNTYHAPADVQACELLRRADPTLPSCLDPAIKYDSLICYNKLTGASVWDKRFDPYDAYNIACVFQGPNCPAVPGTDSDFGQAPMLYGNNRAAVGQKNGNLHIFNIKTGQIYSSRAYGPGGIVGGFLFGMTASTNPWTKKTTLIGGIVNAESHPWVLKNGTTINSSFWVGIHGITGDIEWELVEDVPSLARGSVSSVNDVVFLGNRNGRMSAVNIQTGQVLWKFESGSTIIAAPAITRRRIFFGNGYPTVNLGVGQGHSVYAFTLSRSSCPFDFDTDYSLLDNVVDYFHELD